MNTKLPAKQQRKLIKIYLPASRRMLVRKISSKKSLAHNSNLVNYKAKFQQLIAVRDYYKLRGQTRKK